MMNAILIDADDIEAPKWFDSAEVFVDKVLVALGRKDWEVSVLVCSTKRMAEINQEFRGKSAPTDVLSFPQVDSAAEIPASGPFLAGDIVLCPEFIRTNAADFDVGDDEELRRVIIHGVLHLSGLDHATNDVQKEPMLQEQERLLSLLEKENIHIL